MLKHTGAGSELPDTKYFNGRVFQYIVKAKDSIIFLIVRTSDGENGKGSLREKKVSCFVFFWFLGLFLVNVIGFPKLEMCSQIT